MKSMLAATLLASTILLFSARDGFCAPGPNDGQSQKYQTLETFPDKVQAKLENRDRFLKALPRNVNGFSLEYVIRRTKRWHPGQTIRVAFLGGDAVLRKDIETTSEEWAALANIKLDFGVVQGSDTYREWSPTDSQYAAELRISFNQDGYWSFVGTDSVDTSVTGPGEASMNYGGFDVLGLTIGREWCDTNSDMRSASSMNTRHPWAVVTRILGGTTIQAICQRKISTANTNLTALVISLGCTPSSAGRPTIGQKRKSMQTFAS